MTPRPIIETARLRLRPPEPGDAEPLFHSYASDPEVARFVRWTPASSLERVQEFLRSVAEDWESGRIFQWVVADLDSNVPFGMIGLQLDDHGGTIGYALSKSRWRQGYATEAARAIVDEAFADPRVHRVSAYCDLENRASARVLEKLGMSREGVLRQFVVHPTISSEPRDAFMYSIIRDDRVRLADNQPESPRKTRVIHGDRVGARGVIMTGCGAAIFNDDRSAILLTRRTDNGQWCFPGGRLEPGESTLEACAREVLEETGLVVKVTRLIGLYSSPEWLLEYPDGNRVQVVGCFFEAKVLSGTLGLSDETTEFGYFSEAECATLDIFDHHVERIHDAFENRAEPVLR